MSRRVLNVTAAEVMDIFKGTPSVRDFAQADFEKTEPDSITLVELVMEAEKRLGVEVPDKAFMHAGNVGQLAEAVAAHVNAKYDGREPHHLAPHRFERRA